MEAYCVKCKTKREITEPQAVFTANGTPATKGKCGVCGTTLFRMGATEAHAGLPKPEVQPRAKSKRNGNSQQKRSGKLVIVESPAKAKTVGRFLGKGYTVRASVGHIRDLLKSTLSVDIAKDFEPKYRVPNEKKQVVKELKTEAARAEEIFLATDPDREGEAISWHLLEAAEIDPARAQRVVFHEITKPAIEAAFAHPHAIDMDLVNAQQTRRILDRLVGYPLSELLQKKVRRNLSAGRVQSVAVRLIVDRERDIQAFVPVEYWSLVAELEKATPTGPHRHGTQRRFHAKLVRVDEHEVGSGADCLIKTEAQAHALAADLSAAHFWVERVKVGERRRSPQPPFTTSTLQQEAGRKLGFTAKRTMATAQQLYEGLDLGDGQTVGLITYMRTDSVNVSELAQREARDYVTTRFGADFVPPTPPQYKTRTKNAQEAHEAIRPTAVMREPKALEKALTKDQYRLYTLIWQRFVASQMTPAVFDTLTVDIAAQGAQQRGVFRVAGSTTKFPGFMVIYEEARDEDAAPDDEDNQTLPTLEADDPLTLHRLHTNQHFTQPPPRYTESSLVRALEEYGIGRPSTYAPIISTIQQRGYVLKEDKRLRPTATGALVNDLLMQHFPEIVDLNFTARLEDRLDEVADGQRPWMEVLREFWGTFSHDLNEARVNMPQHYTGPEPVGRDCPKCGQPLVYRYSRSGEKFIGCSGFAATQCRYTEPILVLTGAKCPSCGTGDLAERKTKKRRIFYGCTNYPACDFTSWKRPLPNPCPHCGGLLVVANKTTAQCLRCERETELATLEGAPVSAPTP